MLPGCQVEEVSVHSRRAALVAVERAGGCLLRLVEHESRFACDVESWAMPESWNPGRRHSNHIFNDVVVSCFFHNNPSWMLQVGLL